MIAEFAVTDCQQWPKQQQPPGAFYAGVRLRLRDAAGDGKQFLRRQPNVAASAGAAPADGWTWERSRLRRPPSYSEMT
jgi:hypothetical protein